MNQSNAVAAIPAAQPFSLAPRNFDEAWRLAEWQAMTEDQRVEIVRAAFESNEPEPF